MSDDADDARRAEHRRNMAARGLPLGFGPPDPTGFEGRREDPPANVGTDDEWGPFEFTPLERATIGAAIKHFGNVMLDLYKSDAHSRHIELALKQELNDTLDLIEIAIRHEVQQCPPKT